MASAVTANKVSAEKAFQIFPHKPNSTAATICTPDQGTTKEWVDITIYDTFAVTACNHTLTGNGLTLLELVAADDATGANTIVIVSSGALTGTAVGNGAFLECNVKQVKEVGAASATTPKFVAARLTVQNSSDTCAVSYLRDDCRRAKGGLTAATF
jgi:hypothetical protein